MCKARSNADLLDTLKNIQDINGYISDEDIRKIAIEYGKFPSEIYETATFYSMLHVGSKAEHVIEVCGSTCCDTEKATALIQAISEELGIGLGETTPDNKWMLKRCECLGRCDTAPNMMFDNTLITNAKIDEVIQMIRKGGIE